MLSNRRDWFVPTPATGDSSNRVPDTAWVNLAISNATIAIAQLGTVAGLTVLANASSGTSSLAAIKLPLGAITSIGGLTILANASTGSSSVVATTLSLFLDSAMSSTEGAILYRNSASWLALAAGTAGKILQTQGTSAAPQWIGGTVLLNTLTPSATASARDTTSLTSTYRNYLITFENVCAVASAASFEMQVATSGTAFTTAGYVSMAQVIVSAIVAIDNSTAAILLSGTRATTQLTSTVLYGVNGYMMVNNPAGANLAKMFTGLTAYQTSSTIGTTTQAMAQISGFQNLSTPITGVNFLFNTGNIATGTIRIYGLF